MQLVFRKFPAPDVPPPAPGEIYVRPAAVHAGTAPSVAALVLEHGTAALIQGSGPASCLVVDASTTNPTLDDMLAATFAAELFEGRPLPSGCQAFAHYAAVLRQGLRPADIPPEESIEGVFLAIRNAAGKNAADLTNSEVAERFRKDWTRLAHCLLQAAAQGVNPLKTSPVAGRSEFIQERAFLLRDREVYRQDVLRGERWRVRLPGGPVEASGLFLRRPTSLFFPYWSRTDREAPVGSAYLFLAVDWGDGIWVLTTDPAQRLPIPTLAKALQAAEAAHDPVYAAKDPWYDGHRPEHGHTLVTTPRGGTQLSERAVLRVVKKWAYARSVASSRRWLLVASAAVVLLALAGGGWALFKPTPPAPTPSQTDSSVRVILPGQTAPAIVLVQHDPRTNLPSAVETKNLELNPGTETREELAPQPFPAPYDHGFPVQMWLSLRANEGASLSGAVVTVQVNDGPEQTTIPRDNAGTDQALVFDVPVDVQFAAKNTIAVRVTCPTATTREATLRIAWRPKGNLYVLAVGVSKYAPSGGLPNLSMPAADAEGIVDSFKGQEGKVFKKVIAHSPCDENATRAKLFDEFKWLKDSCKPLDLAVVLLAGHGEKSDSGFFFFAPFDYDRRNKRKYGLSATDLFAELGELPCDTLLLLDCCHSGAFSGGIALPGSGSLSARRGLVVFAATQSDEEAQARQEWKHGALTLAVLEGLQNRYQYPREKADRRAFPEPLADGLITLNDLNYFVARRVRELTGDEQAFTSSWSRDLSPQQVPIAPQ